VGPGTAPSRVLGTAELFDPITVTWAVVGSLSTARDQHTATLLNNGRVLVAGGLDAAGTALASTEIYDPSTQSWSSGPPMAEARAQHTETLLNDGQVLVAGGANAGGIAVSAEVYDPVANSWSSPVKMITAHAQHSATRLANGQVLLVGGQPDATGTEIYNPATNSFQAAAPMPATPGGGVAEGAVLLPSGKVLQLPGEIYDPVSNSWQPSVVPPANNVGNVTMGASATTAILLPNGRVLAAGGSSGLGYPQVYDPVMQAWIYTATPGGFSLGGSYSTVTALQDGRVLAEGGATTLYDPTQNSWSVGGSKAHSGPYAASDTLGNGQVLVTGPDSNADLFDPATNTWTPAAPMSTARQEHTASALQNGVLLVTGGLAAAPLSSAEVYNPTTNSWSTTGPMSTPRFQHTASVLSNGMVLVAGGNDMYAPCNCTTFVNAADLFNSSTNTFTPTGALVTARYAHTATLVTVGGTQMVLVAGGFGGPTSIIHSGGALLASAELYNPTTGKWTATGSMTRARMNHTAILLPSGMVLVAGG
jgi:N-acetylneuraminic acid mutarotase